MDRRFAWGWLVSLTLAVAIAGCVVVPDQRHYPGGVVMVAPPPPRVEVIGVAPTPGYVWIGGYWNWVGDRHEWVAGHWAAPRAGYHWVPHALGARRRRSWRMRPARRWVRPGWRPRSSSASLTRRLPGYAAPQHLPQGELSSARVEPVLDQAEGYGHLPGGTAGVPDATSARLNHFASSSS